MSLGPKNAVASRRFASNGVRTYSFAVDEGAIAGQRRHYDITIDGTKKTPNHAFQPLNYALY